MMFVSLLSASRASKSLSLRFKDGDEARVPPCERTDSEGEGGGGGLLDLEPERYALPPLPPPLADVEGRELGAFACLAMLAEDFFVVRDRGGPPLIGWAFFI